MINRSSGIPVYQQISRRLEEKILSGKLPAGFKLPSERRLASEIGVHRNTVIKAYDELIRLELVVVSSEKQKGYFVKELKEQQNFGKRFFPLEKAFRYEFRHAEKCFDEIYWKSARKEMISFGSMVMDRKISPISGLEHVVQDIFNNEENDSVTRFCEETERLRRNICKLLTHQNIYVSTKNIQILAESNQVLGYLITFYMSEGDCIVSEEPMVPDNYSVFYNRGINVITVPMEEDGMNLELLEDAIRKFKPKFIYTQPNYHNPTGISMSLNKRCQLLKMANEYNVPIIEEDYQGDFGLEERAVPSLYALDDHRLVIYVNSFSLSVPYMLKIGYTVGPPDYINMLWWALGVDETTIGGIGQYFLNALIESGEYERHILTLQKHYEEKRRLFCRELDKLSEKGLTYVEPDGGLLIWCTLSDEINERLFCKIAEDKGVLTVPGWVFYDDQKRKKKGHVRLCFSNVTDDQIRRGVELLGQALDECRLYEKEKGEPL